MAYETRKLIIAALGGFLVAALIISGIVSVGILPEAERPVPVPRAEAKGLLIIKVKDDPASLEELWLNISRVKVHRKGEGNETWYDVPLATGPFDLLKLANISTVLAAGELQAGNYTEIRFHLDSAWANITGESRKDLRITTEWVMVKTHFTIEDDSVTEVTLDIEVNEEPILRAGILMPVAKATVSYVG